MQHVEPYGKVMARCVVRREGRPDEAVDLRRDPQLRDHVLGGGRFLGGSGPALLHLHWIWNRGLNVDPGAGSATRR